ncbi:WGR domain-containing protein (plasmid) [Sphingomonadaceae bacterium OTU29LAMAA1]|nr:WGR domain-containing protein [Sphingomonadaceae bacterium OTU29LAMAA1]
MDTLPFTPVELVAIDAARNIRRRWRIAAYRDLFGQVMIETGWGRIGGQGRELVRSFADEGDALRYVRALLVRRGSATRRIGVGYRPINPTRRGVDMPTGRAPSAPAPSSHI